MGGQACVLYGAAEFSRTTDIVVMADSDLIPTRPLLALAKSRDRDSLQAELEVEEKQERQLDRDYWNPLRAELEQLRRREHS